MLEELRMSTFAQPLGVDGPVSAKRIRIVPRRDRSAAGSNRGSISAATWSDTCRRSRPYGSARAQVRPSTPGAPG